MTFETGDEVNEIGSIAINGADALQFAILGPLAVARDGRAVEVKGPKQRALLLFLLLHPNQIVSTDRIIDALWGEELDHRAMGTLRVHIANLRRVLEPDRPSGSRPEVLLTKPTGYLLQIDPEAIDANRFERLAGEGRRALSDRAELALERLTAALNLWRGAALEDVGYETFAQADIQRLHELRMLATEDLIEARLAMGEHADLVGELESQVARNPLRERLWSQLMLALFRNGRQADALAAHRRLSDLLAQQGLVPGHALAMLENRILVNDATLLRSAMPIGPHRLPPAERTRLVGRDELVAVLRSRLASSRLLTLTGTGGVGKTRLAQRLAWSMIEDGHVVWWVELSGLFDPHRIPEHIASAGGLAESADMETSALLVRILSNRQVLIVLDNCEHLIDAAALLVDRLLTEVPGVRLVATTREPLQVHGEQVWRVSSLPVPDPASTTAEMAESPSVELFLERALARGVEVAAAALPAVADICRRLDGIPLAIELAAARTSTLAPEDISTRLADRFSLLERGGRTALARHRTLAAAIDWSFRLLDEGEQRLLSRLAVFGASFDLEAAQEVCSFPPLSAFEVEAGVERLLEKSMLEVSGRRPGRRFQMTESIHAFAWDRLVDDPEQMLARHRTWALRLAVAGSRGILSDEGQWFPKLEAAHEDFRAAFAEALRHDEVDAALRLVGSLSSYLCWRSTNVALEWLETVVGAAEARPELTKPTTMALGYLALGPYLCYHQRFDEGRQMLARAADLYQELGHPIGVMWTRFQQSFFPLANHPDECVAYAKEAVDLARQLSDPVAMAYSLSRLAETLLLRLTHRGYPMPGELETVLSLCEEADLHCRDLPQPYASAVVKTVAGTARALGGQPEVGLNMIEAGLAERRRFAAGVLCAAELVSVGQLAFGIGYEDRGTAMVRQGLEAFKDLGVLYSTRSALVGAAAAVRKQDPVIAARVLGAASRLQPSFLYGTSFITDEQRVVDEVGADLGDGVYAVEVAIGTHLGPREAIDLVLAITTSRSVVG